MTHQSSFAVIYWLRFLPSAPSSPPFSHLNPPLSYLTHTRTCQQPLHLTPSRSSNQERVIKSTKSGQVNKTRQAKRCFKFELLQFPDNWANYSIFAAENPVIRSKDSNWVNGSLFFCQWLFPRSRMNCPLTLCNCLLTLTPTLTLGHNPYGFWPRSHRGSSPGASRTPFGKACWAKKRGAPVERGCMGNCMIKSK